MQSTLLQIVEDNDVHVLKVLRYYSIFDYPLKREEIHRYCAYPCTPNTLAETLDALVDEGAVYYYQSYYSLSSTIEIQVKRREAGNTLALSQMPQARKAGSFIYMFPFVRFVGISGSLSKGFASPGSDYDFFIVTEKNRLWICRTLLHVFKKITFLYGQQHKYCMNYFIDTTALELEDQNVFTAIELGSMIPVKGECTYKQLLQANHWMHEYLPNMDIAHNPVAIKKDPFAKRIQEGIISLCYPSGINKWLMALTNWKWQKKWARKNYPPEDYKQAFKTTLHISKNHPANYQKRVLNLLKRMNDVKHESPE